MKTKRVTDDLALAEFERWAEGFDMDTTAEDVEPFRNKFTRRVMNGSLAVEDDGTLIVATKGNGEPLRFSEPQGSVLSARQPKDTDIQATRRILAAWAGVPVIRFSEMSLRDFTFCSEVLGFFANS